MSLEGMKAKIRWAGEEAWLKGNLDALDEVYDPEYVCHRPPFPDLVGLDGVKASMADMRGAYTELRISYADMVAEGSTIAYRFTWTGKHTGQSPSLPIPPTGNEVSLHGCLVVQIAHVKIGEEFENSDYLGLLQQVGVVPALG